MSRDQRLIAKQQAKADKEQAKAAYEKARAEREQWAAVRKQLREVKASYRGAVQTRISSPWSQSTSVTGVVNLTRFNARQLRDRARQLERENAIADSMLTRCIENVIGSDGFKLQVRTDDLQWNQQAESLMATEFFPFADFYGLSWVQHQKLVFRSLQRDGDIGVTLLSNGQLQPIEGDYIASPVNQNDEVHYDGVVLDSLGRPIAYWIQSGSVGDATYTRIAAKDFVFLARRKMLSQLRGEPCFTTSFTLFDQVAGYIDAVVIAQKIAACFGLIIKMENPTQRIAGLPYGSNADGNQQRQFTIEPGMIQTLNPNETVEQLKPEQPGRNFEPSLRALLRILGLNLGLPIELVLLDFSQTTYSSARASLQQAQRSFEGLQNQFIDEYLSRVYRWRISKFIKDGKLQDRPDKFRHTWHGQPWPYLNPVEEVQAQQLLIDAGLSTQTAQLKKLGIEIEQWRAERGDEIAKNKAAGIPQVRSSLVAEITQPAEETSPGQQNQQGENEDTDQAAA